MHGIDSTHCTVIERAKTNSSVPWLDQHKYWGLLVKLFVSPSFAAGQIYSMHIIHARMHRGMLEIRMQENLPERRKGRLAPVYVHSPRLPIRIRLLLSPRRVSSCKAAVEIRNGKAENVPCMTLRRTEMQWQRVAVPCLRWNQDHAIWEISAMICLHRTTHIQPLISRQKLISRCHQIVRWCHHLSQWSLHLIPPVLEMHVSEILWRKLPMSRGFLIFRPKLKRFYSSDVVVGTERSAPSHLNECNYNCTIISWLAILGFCFLRNLQSPTTSERCDLWGNEVKRG